MDIVNIVALIGSLITIADAGKGVFFAIFRKRREKKIRICDWDSKDPSEKRVIDAFRSSMMLQYPDHIFSETEIEDIIAYYFRENATLTLSEENKKMISDGIRKTLLKYNEYVRSSMTPGESILFDEIEKIRDRDFAAELEERENAENMRRFLEMVKESKTLRLREIENRINGEYEIDRSAAIREIQSQDKRFIAIVGNAGSGKSALARKLVEAEEYVLYARADQFARAVSLSDVWLCDLSKAVTELKGKRCTILIDALEFIADCRSDKLLMLRKLFCFAKEHDNILLIITCRTEDQNAFFPYFRAEHDFFTYEIQDLSGEELSGIAARYPVIRKMAEQNCYADLLRSPFYINIIVSRLPVNYNIQDENSLRGNIWHKVICLEDKAAEYGVAGDEIRKEVEKITFQRAKLFESGIHASEIKADILRILISEGIAIEEDGRIRLKYDIYEDICFENRFDQLFDACKGNYADFFAELTDLGKCVYRRYQIWISNKLFLKTNREKFIYALMFGKTIPQEWNSQTEIGIVKSRYCAPFFAENAVKMIASGKMQEILRIINLYAFEAEIMDNNETGFPFLSTRPAGVAREAVITELYKDWENVRGKIEKDVLITLCRDYAGQNERDGVVSGYACEMIQSYIDAYLAEKPENWYYRTEQMIVPLLLILYRMADACKKWIADFLLLLCRYMEVGNSKEKRWARETLQATFDNACLPLVRVLPKELCCAMETLWLEKDEPENEFERYMSFSSEKVYAFGLSDSANDFLFRRREVKDCYFLWNLFTKRFDIGFSWAIRFINRSIDCYVKHKAEDVEEIILWFKDGEVKKYRGTASMWMYGIEENVCPLLLSDMLFVMKKVIIMTIGEWFSGNRTQEAIRFAEDVRDKLYAEANNIALLTVIEAIGMNFQKELPGYAVNLASSISLIRFDNQRYGLYTDDPARKLLEQQMLQIVGISSLERRYELDSKCNLNLQNYMIAQQMMAKDEENEEILQKCYRILDNLYLIMKNEGEEAYDYMKIQMMDFRRSSIEQIDGNHYLVEQSLSGEAEKIARIHEEHWKVSSVGRIEEKLMSTEVNLITAQGKPDIEEINRFLDFLIGEIDRDEVARIKYENIMVNLIAVVLTDPDVEQNRRDAFCSLWIDGLNRFFSNDTFSSDNKSLPVLFQQLEMNIGDSVRDRIKRLMLKALLYSGENGIIFQIASGVKEYLYRHRDLAKVFFRTIILLAKTRKESGKEELAAEKERIIEWYLLRELELNLDLSNLSVYNIDILCYAAGCGMGFDEEPFYRFVQELILSMIRLWHADKHHSPVQEPVGVYAVQEIVQLFQRELTSGQSSYTCVIDILFDDVPIESFTQDAIDFYYDIFSLLGALYFDASADVRKRKTIEDIVRYIGSKISRISSGRIRTALERVLIFAFTERIHDDWNTLKATYSYSDKFFLNDQFRKYGKNHIKDIFFTVYMFHMRELLPEILLSIGAVMEEMMWEDEAGLERDVMEVMGYADLIILLAFMEQSEKIKQDADLTEAFEKILNILVHMSNPRAAVILDEFRVH